MAGNLLFTDLCGGFNSLLNISPEFLMVLSARYLQPHLAVSQRPSKINLAPMFDGVFDALQLLEAGQVLPPFWSRFGGTMECSSEPVVPYPSCADQVGVVAQGRQR